MTARGSVELAVNRIVDDAREERLFVREGNRHAEAWIAVREIGGAVERIDVPAIFGSVLPAGTFLGGDGMFRKVFREARDDGLFGTLVGLRDEVHVAFVRDMRWTVELFAQDFPGFKRDFDRRCKIVFWLQPFTLWILVPRAVCSAPDSAATPSKRR